MRKAVLFFAIVILGMSIYGQCPISQTTEVGTFGAGQIGQSFTATCDGQIEEISVMVGRVIGPWTMTLTIYDNNNNPPDVNAQTYSELVSFSADYDDVDVFTLATPYPVNAGQSYKMIYTPTTGGSNFEFHASNVNPYAGGVFVSGNTELSSHDLWFTVDIQPVSSVPLSPLVVIMVFALVGFVVWFIKR